MSFPQLSTRTERAQPHLRRERLIAILLVISLLGVAPRTQPDPLPSWNDGPCKRAILGFVSRVTTPGSPGFVSQAERIATFDNDGTLWTEQPMYTQMAFVLDRVKALAPQHPQWKRQQPFKAILEGDLKTLAADGEKGMMQVLTATSTGMTTQDFEVTVKQWISTAKHPRFHRPYTECVYQPMLELMAFLRANGFKTYITSGGGVEFMRPWTEQVYGIPPEQVIGSSVKTKFEIQNGQPVLVRLPRIDLVDDKDGKPVGINEFIGRRPIAAFGNSDGDQQMLEWTAIGKGPRLMLIVHHTDSQREYAYDRQSSFGRLDAALDEAQKRAGSSWT